MSTCCENNRTTANAGAASDPAAAPKPQHDTGKDGAERFRNPWPSFAAKHSFFSFLWMRMFDWRSVKIPKPADMPNVFPSVNPNWPLIRKPNTDKIQSTWV